MRVLLSGFRPTIMLIWEEEETNAKTKKNVSCQAQLPTKR